MQHPAIDAFFKRLSAAKCGTLMLDYDGTLAPFKVDRSQAFPYPGVATFLKRVHEAGQTRIIIVSGRSISDLDPLIADLPADEIWGSHGWERISSGNHVWRALSVHQDVALTKAGLFVERQGWVGLELKPASVAFHVRGLDNQVAAQRKEVVAKAWSEISCNSQLIVHLFDGGVELRPSGFNKGSVEQEVLKVTGPNSAVAYLGDDFTDEDAFEAIGRRGLSVLVRPDFRPTAADAWIKPPKELLEFFQKWLNAVP